MIQPGERVLVAVSGGKDSLAVWDILRRARLRGRRPLPRARHRRLQRRVRRVRPRVRRAPGLAAASRSTCPSDYGYDIPTGPRRPSACRARPAASRSATSSTRPRSRAATTSSSPATTSTTRRPVLFGNVLRWQTDYLGRQLPGAARAPRLPPQGEAARPARRARDGGVLRGPRHRLHRRGVPDGGRQQAPRLQGGAQRHRGRVARHEARLLLRVPRARPRPVRRRGRGRAGRPRAVRAVRRADPGRDVRVLPPRRAGRRAVPGRARPDRSSPT